MARREPKASTTKPKEPKAPKKDGRLKQLRQTYTMTREVDPRIGLILLAWLLGVGAVAFALAYFLIAVALPFAIVFGVLIGTLAAMIVFGRRAQRSAISQIEGKPGAAASVLGLLRRGWKVEPAVAFTKQQDVVTRVVGPPGIVLVGEGNHNRLKTLLANERRRHERVASEVAITEVYVGDGEGEIPLQRLVKHVSKLPKALKPAMMTDVLARLRAIDAMKTNVPLPKGPVPTSMKGARGNLRGR